MTDATDLHRNAMTLADEAHSAKLHGDISKATALLRKAFEKEREAASKMATRLNIEPTRSVLHRSAATLAIECGEHREAERLISTALSGQPPDEIADELRGLLEQVYFVRHLSLRGFALHPDEFQLSLAGNSVGSGITHTDEFVKRVTDLESLVYRTAERQARRAYRERGRRKASLQEELELYISVPRAASFAVSFKLGRSEQLSIPGLDFPEAVIDELFECLRLFNSLDTERLHNRIRDEAYFRNFVGLVRRVAPDGDRIKLVGFTATRRNENVQVVLTTPRERTTVLEQAPEPAMAKKILRVRGVLRYADSRKENQGIIQLLEEGGKLHRIKVPAGMMSDIVRPLWDTEVLVTGEKQGNLVLLQDIGPV